MAKRRTTQGQDVSSKTNGEGNEKTDNSSSVLADLQTYSVSDPTDSGNVKIRGLAAGYRDAIRTK